MREPWRCLPRVRNAGGVFLGEGPSEALGDYAIGPSHIMPTGGTARFASPVNVWDFVKITSVFAPGPRSRRHQRRGRRGLARAEGLMAHAPAILMRSRTSTHSLTVTEPIEAASGSCAPTSATMEEYTPILPFAVLSRRFGIPADAHQAGCEREPLRPGARGLSRRSASCRHYNIYPDPGADAAARGDRALRRPAAGARHLRQRLR